MSVDCNPTSPEVILPPDRLLQLAHTAAHDLRSPLSTLTSIAEFFAQRYQGTVDAEGVQCLAMMEQAADAMRRLIDNLLLYIDVTAEPVRAGSGDAEEAIRTSVRKLQRKIARLSAGISHDPLPRIAADTAMVARVFEHLIDNGISYCAKDVVPKVHVEAVREDGLWLFRVSDNGEGIAPEYHAVIFEPLKKLHPPEIAGSGLGLAIAKAIVESHGGRIFVESAPGRGSIFSFTMPASD